MRVISKATINEFIGHHADAKEPLLFWYDVTRRAGWASLAATRADFPHADPVSQFTVFNIAGNKYRLIAVINYRWQIVYVRFILTHAEYTRGRWKS